MVKPVALLEVGVLQDSLHQCSTVHHVPLTLDTAVLPWRRESLRDHQCEWGEGVSGGVVSLYVGAYPRRHFPLEGLGKRTGYNATEEAWVWDIGNGNMRIEGERIERKLAPASLDN